MTVLVEDGVFKVTTEVEGTTVVEVRDEKEKLIDKFAFGIGEGSISESAFIGNTTIDGKIAYVAKVDTDNEELVDNLKKLYGKALIRAKEFEPQAKSQVVCAKAAAKAEADAIDALFA